MGQGLAESFEKLQLHLHSGDAVRVTNAEGERTEGQVVAISASSLEVAVREATRSSNRSLVRRPFTPPEVATIARQNRDLIWNGGIIGAGIAVIPGVIYTIARSGGSDPLGGAAARITVLPAVAGFAIGALIDAMRHSWSPVYRSPMRVD